MSDFRQFLGRLSVGDALLATPPSIILSAVAAASILAAPVAHDPLASATGSAVRFAAEQIDRHVFGKFAVIREAGPKGAEPSSVPATVTGGKGAGTPRADVDATASVPDKFDPGVRKPPAHKPKPKPRRAPQHEEGSWLDDRPVLIGPGFRPYIVPNG